MKTISVKIPSMKSAHCIMTVSKVLQEVENINVVNISLGQAEIELLDNNQASVLEAINKAGYQIAEIQTTEHMENKTFKTNIKCEGCLAKVTPHLNESVGEGKWHVDLNNPAKTLNILTDSSVATVKAAVEKAGFKAEPI